MNRTDGKLVEVNDLKVYYWTSRGPVRAVDGVTFSINRGERFGLVGESGCGKSTTAMTLLRLITPPGGVDGGEILLNGTDLLRLTEREMRDVRWSHIALIMQGAMNSLNPTMRIRDQIVDVIVYHQHNVKRREAGDRVGELLRMVELSPNVAHMYPHELSGGMKQRVCIAMAIALEPDLIIADEPTSALDVVVQHAVMETLIAHQERLGSSLMLIGHDMGLQAQVVDRLAVMYAGKMAEIGTVQAIFEEPLHPYTEALIASLPSVRERRQKKGIPGMPPLLLEPPPGCVFHPRCPRAMKACQTGASPELREIKPGRFVSCHLYDER